MAKIPGPAKGQIDLTKGSLPILVALTLACMIAAAAYGVGSFVKGLMADNERAGEKFATIETDLKAIRSLIENGNFMRKSEFDAWCRNAEILNRGFKCGNIR
jgi:hypothetical protein